MQDKEWIVSKRMSRTDWNRSNKDCVPITFWCRTVNSRYEKWNQKMHSHTFWELHLCLCGKCTLQLDLTSLELTQNQMILIKPGQIHTTANQSDDYTELVWGFSVPDHSVHMLLIEFFGTPMLQIADKNILSAVEQIVDNMWQQEYGFYSVVQAQLSSIFFSFVRHTGCLNNSVGYEKTHSKEMMQIVEYVRENLFSNITLDDVSTAFFVGKGYINRLCNEEYGMSFVMMKRQLQTERIRELLKDNDMSVDEIARETGFTDRYSLSKFFKKQEGMPPVQYRKSFRK